LIWFEQKMPENRDVFNGITNQLLYQLSYVGLNLYFQLFSFDFGSAKGYYEIALLASFAISIRMKLE